MECSRFHRHFVHNFTAHGNHGRSGPNQCPGVLKIDASRGHEKNLGKRPHHGFDIVRSSKLGSGEDLDHICPCVPPREDLCRSHRARNDYYAVTVQENEVKIKGRTYDELGPRQNGCPPGFRVQDGSRSDYQNSSLYFRESSFAASITPGTVIVISKTAPPSLIACRHVHNVCRRSCSDKRYQALSQSYPIEDLVFLHVSLCVDRDRPFLSFPIDSLLRKNSTGRDAGHSAIGANAILSLHSQASQSTLSPFSLSITVKSLFWSSVKATLSC